jgi:2-amino-4-hydroxy-6-hydroxymethyldihydropteridine diphosphokinase
MRNPDRWTIAYIGLGSNLGDREATLRAALRDLDARGDVKVVRRSHLHETEPVGGPPQGAFINAVAELATPLSPKELLQVLHEVEDEFGRERTVRWGPRTLDLDLLLYGDRIIDMPALHVPHPRMHERRFVLEPLCELCPDRPHPRLGKTIQQLLSELEDED